MWPVAGKDIRSVSENLRNIEKSAFDRRANSSAGHELQRSRKSRLISHFSADFLHRRR